MSFKLFNGLPTTDQIIREYAATGQLRCGASFTIDQSAIDQKARSVSGTASVEEVSRTRLLIDIEGMDLSGFKKNPVVLAGHHDVVPSTLMPAVVALVGSIAKKEGSLIFRSMTFDQDELSEAWFQKISRGFVRMVSVGIVPQDAEFVEEEVGRGDKKKLIRYVRINQSELIEISVVPIGANRGAFIDPQKQESAELAALRQEIGALRSALDGVHGDLKSQKESILDIGRTMTSNSSPSKVAEVISLCEGIVRRPA